MNSFDHASHFVINGLSQTDIHIGDDNYKSNKAFERLHNHAVAEASLDAADRYDAPKCHPQTRKAVLSAIQTWIDDTHKTTRILWLSGPAGAGKSAIAQSTAEAYHKEGRLIASFFFSRFSMSRNKKDGLVASIAYQLCLACPAVKNSVLRNVDRNPNIFKSNIKAQLLTLVIEPFNTLPSEGLAIPRVIAIDGLDECLIRRDQEEIVEAIINVMSTDTSSGISFLLVSRPEVEIRQKFEDSSSSLCSRLILDDKFNPDSDIELYLRSNFASLKRQHTLRSTLPASWPPEDAIHNIVEKSSGQFIYASTVVHYISDPRHDPRKRLDIILNIRPGNGESPFSQLDVLYRTILSACNDYSKLSPILEAIMFLDGFNYITSVAKKILASPQYLNSFLSLEEDCLLTLADFHSIIDVTGMGKKPIRFYHASFYDFLMDQDRSQEFYINRQQAHAHLAMCCFIILSKSHPQDFPEPIYIYCIECFSHFKSSSWDDDVLTYVREYNLLRKNSRLHVLLKFVHDFHRLPITSQSPLGFLVEVVDKRHSVNPDVQRLIDSELLQHFVQYQQDQLILLYNFRASAGHGEYLFQNMSYILGPNISQFKPEDAIMNDFLCLDPAFEWLQELMQSSGYLSGLPDNVQSQSLCHLLDIARHHPFNFDKYDEQITSVLNSIVDQLPLSNEISGTLRQKWESVEKHKWRNDKLKQPFRDVILNYSRMCEVKLNSTKKKGKKAIVFRLKGL